MITKIINKKHHTIIKYVQSKINNFISKCMLARYITLRLNFFSVKYIMSLHNSNSCDQSQSRTKKQNVVIGLKYLTRIGPNETASAKMSHHPPVSCIPNTGKMSKAKKVIEEAKEINNPEIDLVDKGISSLDEIPGLFSLENITRLTLSHNKIQVVPATLANLINLEILNLANNHIEELPVSLSSLPKLRILNVSLNRLYGLPRGFGAFPVLEILDLTYNNLKEQTLPGNFFMMESLRALYLGDNDFEYLPIEIGNLKNLQILSMRENDLIEVPRELGQLARLRELHLQGNRLVVLPPEIGTLDLASNKSVLRLEGNFWVPPIEDQLKLGPSHVLDYLRSETYKVLYSRHMSAKPPPPPQNLDKSKKASRARS